MDRADVRVTIPSVSIGMPVYNGETYIREALDSLLQQTFTDFELIISDNASTDGTGVICKEYAFGDSRIRYIRQATNLGAVGNFEFVLNEARGEYFMWAAHDDLQGSLNYLEELVGVIRDGGYGLVFPAIEVISTADGKSRVVGTHILDRFLTCKTREDYCIASIHHYYQIYGLFRRISLLQNLGYMQRAGSTLNCDTILVQAMSANSSVCYVPTATKIYRVHGDQSSDTINPLGRLVDYLEVTRLCVNFWLREADVPFKTRVLAMLALLHCNGYGIIYRALRPVKQFSLRIIGRRMAHP